MVAECPWDPTSPTFSILSHHRKTFRVLQVVYHSDSPLPQGPKDSSWSKMRSFGRHLEFLAVQPEYLPATMATTEHAHEQCELTQPLGPREGGGDLRFSKASQAPAATGVTEHGQTCQWVIPRRVCEFTGSSLYNTHSTLNRVWANYTQLKRLSGHQLHNLSLSSILCKEI